MSRNVRYSEAVAGFLRSHPHAEEARTFIDCLARDLVSGHAATEIDGAGTGIALLEESGRLIWWHYEGPDRQLLVIDGIDDD